MNKILLVILLGGLTAEACYAAPGHFTGWCNAHRGIAGSWNLMVTYCFDVHGSMSMNCDVMASNYPGKGEGAWGAYNVGVINDGDCVKMFWGTNSAMPSARCWSYGLPVTFGFTART